MVITESQLRLIVRQELLEVLNENSADALNESLKNRIIDIAAPIFMVLGMAGATGSAFYGNQVTKEQATQEVTEAANNIKQNEDGTYSDTSTGSKLENGIITLKNGKQINAKQIVGKSKEEIAKEVPNLIGSASDEEIAAICAFMAIFSITVGAITAGKTIARPTSNRR